MTILPFNRSADSYEAGASDGWSAIDSHVHFWKFDKDRDRWITNEMKLLRQNYLPEQLTLTLNRNNVGGVIAVQADSSELETHFLIELANTHPIIKGVVGWVDLQQEGLESRLDYFSTYPILKGWRHIVQAEADDFLLQPRFQRGVAFIQARNYAYDLLVYPRQLPAAVAFANTLANAPIILDHCAKPLIATKEITDWEKWIRQLALAPHVYCKLSGLFTETNWKSWSPADFYPYLDVVFDAFGTKRLLFGSDWPVMLLSGIYVQWKSLLEKYMEAFTEEEKEAVFSGNARHVYQL